MNIKQIIDLINKRIASALKQYNITDLQNAIPIQLTPQVLIEPSWVLEAPYYKYTFASPHIQENSVVSITPSNDSAFVANAAGIMPQVTVTDGSCIIYAVNAPTGNITVSITIFKSEIK